MKKEKLYILKIMVIMLILSLTPIYIFNKRNKVKRLYFENRPVTKLAELNYENLKKWEYQKKLETRITEIFPGRYVLLREKARLDLMILKKVEFSEVLIEDELLLPYHGLITHENEKLKNSGLNNLKALNTYLKEKDINLYFTMVPAQYTMFFDKYPWYLNSKKEIYQNAREDLKDVLIKEKIAYKDFHETFQKDPLKYYYKTDHHMSFEATKEIRKEIIKYAKSKNLRVEDNIFAGTKKYTDKNFVGSSARKIFKIRDEGKPLEYMSFNIPAYRYNSDSFRNYINYKGFEEFYSFYLGGDNPSTLIDTKRDNLDNILIIGDSVTNALESIIYNDFNKMYSLDFRLLDKNFNFEEYISDKDIKLVVIMSISGNYNNLNKIIPIIK